MCTLSSLQPSFSIFPPLFSSLVVCTYIFVPFATVGLYTGSESLFGSDTLAPRAKDRQFPLGTRLLYFDTRTRTELGVPTLLRYAATTRLNYQGMRTKQTDARARRRHISTHSPSTPARAPTYARAYYLLYHHSHTSNKPLCVSLSAILYIFGCYGSTKVTVSPRRNFSFG